MTSGWLPNEPTRLLRKYYWVEGMYWICWLICICLFNQRLFSIWKCKQKILLFIVQKDKQGKEIIDHCRPDMSLFSSLFSSNVSKWLQLTRCRCVEKFEWQNLSDIIMQLINYKSFGANHNISLNYNQFKFQENQSFYIRIYLCFKLN